MSEQQKRYRGPLTVLCESSRARRRLIVAIIALPVFYLAGFGPACWFAAAPRVPGKRDEPRIWMKFYAPHGALIHHTQLQDSKVVNQWITFGTKKGGRVIVPTDASGKNWYGFTAE
jgi:hypothetical protein